MTVFKATLITMGLIFCWLANGYADRLYWWTDAKGVTHISQDPPPDTAGAVDDIEYSPQPDQSVHRSTASNQPNQEQGELDKGGRQTVSGSGIGDGSGDAGTDVQYQYDGATYWQTKRRYERRGEWLDNNEPGKVVPPPERRQPRPLRR